MGCLEWIRLYDATTLGEIPDELRDTVKFASFEIDAPAHHELYRQHNVLNVPFLAFYRDGSVMRTLTGMRKADVITDNLRELVRGAA